MYAVGHRAQEALRPRAGPNSPEGHGRCRHALNRPALTPWVDTAFEQAFDGYPADPAIHPLVVRGHARGGPDDAAGDPVTDTDALGR